MQTKFSAFILFTLITFFTGSSFGQGYDEIFSSPGQPRPHYKKIWSVYSEQTPEQNQKFLDESKKDFTGDNALLRIPRVYTYDEIGLLRQGVEQRGRALRAFLKDHYSGNKEYLKANLIPQLVIDKIVDRSFEKEAQKYLQTADFNFWYGPDIIKDQNGNFRVVEDNTGFVGGFGDLRIARDILNKRAKEYRAEIDPANDPDVFYEQITSKYKDSAKQYGGIPVLVTYTDGVAADNEDSRLRKIFKDYGIESVKIDPAEPANKKRLVSNSSGLYLEKYDQKGARVSSEKVGYVVLDIETSDIEPFHPMTKDKFLNEMKEWYLEWPEFSVSDKERMKQFQDHEWIKQFKRFEKVTGYTMKDDMGVKGFWNHIISGNAGCTNMIGTEFVNDKLFYVYVEKLIKFYLKEKPILKNIDTESAAIFNADGSVSLNEEVIKKVKANIEDYVGKGAAGRGGDQVYIGRKDSAEKLAEMFENARANPAYYIFQKYTYLSLMNEYIIDQRVLADISSKNTISWTPWGRATPLSGNGKVNISDQGLELASIIYAEPGFEPCDITLRGKSAK